MNKCIELLTVQDIFFLLSKMTILSIFPFFVCSLAEIWPHSQLNLVDFFPDFEKKFQSLKKIFFF